MTPHIGAKKEEISKTVIMPGDPLRAKYIAEKYLEDYTLVSSIRNVYAYTGKYRGKRVTIMASGMGNASMGIYSYELYHFYDVENIIRIGTVGAYTNEIQLREILLAEKSYSKSSYALCFNGNTEDIIEASKELNEKIKAKAKQKNIQIRNGVIHCSDVFYGQGSNYEQPQKYHCLGVEMESFALFANAQNEGKKAACLLTVSNQIGNSKELSAIEREQSLNTMIELALDTVE